MENFQKLTGQKQHFLFKRKLVVFDKYLNEILKCYEVKEKFYLVALYTPTKFSLNLNDINQFLLLKWLQEVFKVPLIIHVNDNHRFLKDSINLKEFPDKNMMKDIFVSSFPHLDSKLSGKQFSNLISDKGNIKEEFRMKSVEILSINCMKEIISIGFDPDQTFLCRNLEYIGKQPAYYESIITLGAKISYSQSNVCYNMNYSDDVETISLPAKDMAAIFPCSYPQIFENGINMRGIVLNLDDSKMKMSRKLAWEMRWFKPASIKSTPLPALHGNGDMDSYDVNSAIFFNDDAKAVVRKINKYAFSGGKDTIDEHEKYGGNCEKDISYQYLKYFLEDPEKLEDIREKYESGKMLTGQLKKKTIDVINKLLNELQNNYKNVSDDLLNKFTAIRSLSFGKMTEIPYYKKEEKELYEEFEGKKIEEEKTKNPIIEEKKNEIKDLEVERQKTNKETTEESRKETEKLIFIGDGMSEESRNESEVLIFKSGMSEELMNEREVLIYKSGMSEELMNEIKTLIFKSGMSKKSRNEREVLIFKSGMNEESRNEREVLIFKSGMNEESRNEREVLIFKSGMSEFMNKIIKLIFKSGMNEESRNKREVLIFKSGMSEFMNEIIKLIFKSGMNEESWNEIIKLIFKSGMSEEFRNKIKKLIFKSGKFKSKNKKITLIFVGKERIEESRNEIEKLKSVEKKPGKETGDVVTPWEVQGDVDTGIDYDKLVENYGSSKIELDLINRFEKVTGRKAHHLLRRGMFYSHRDFNEILDSYEKGEKFFLYTGRGPSSDALHLGHLIPFIFTKWLQDVFDVPLVIQLTDDEKCLMRNISIEDVTRMAIENIKDIIAVGFDINKTFIFRDFQYIGEESAFYKTALRVGSKVNFNTMKAIFGFTEEDSVEKIAFPPVQAATSFSSSFPDIFGDNHQVRSLIPCAIDQDPYFRMTRDVAPRLNMPKPALILSKFFPSLQGNQTKMNASDPKSAIFMTDSPGQIEDKINNHTFTISEERKKTLSLEEITKYDICYQYLTFFMEDPEKLDEIRRGLGDGTVSNDQLKKELISLLTPIVESHQRKRNNITEEQIKDFMKPKFFKWKSTSKES